MTDAAVPALNSLYQLSHMPNSAAFSWDLLSLSFRFFRLFKIHNGRCLCTDNEAMETLRDIKSKWNRLSLVISGCVKLRPKCDCKNFWSRCGSGRHWCEKVCFQNPTCLSISIISIVSQTRELLKFVCLLADNTSLRTRFFLLNREALRKGKQVEGKINLSVSATLCRELRMLHEQSVHALKRSLSPNPFAQYLEA